MIFRWLNYGRVYPDGVVKKQLLVPRDYEACPVWTYDEEARCYFPVPQPSDLPDWLPDVSFRVQFTTPQGHTLSGKVNGVSRIYSIGLFGKKEIYIVNRNVLSYSKKQVELFLKENRHLKVKTVNDLFPLKFITDINRPGFKEFEGEFVIGNML